MHPTPHLLGDYHQAARVKSFILLSPVTIRKVCFYLAGALPSSPVLNLPSKTDRNIIFVCAYVILLAHTQKDVQFTLLLKDQNRILKMASVEVGRVLVEEGRFVSKRCVE